jgi:hypothetical protein
VREAGGGRAHTPAEQRPPGSRGDIAWTAAVAVVALAVGASLGAQVARAAAPDEGSPTVVAGQVTRFPLPATRDLTFETHLQNTGTEPVEVLASAASAGLPGERFLGPQRPTTLQPGQWGPRLLWVPEDCRALSTGAIRVLTRVGSADPVETVIPLPSQSRALLDQRAMHCGDPTPALPEDLVGAWLLEPDYVIGDTRISMVFQPDGGYRLDLGEDLLAGPASQQGRYDVDAGTLTLHDEVGWDPCDRGGTITVPAGLLADGRLYVRFFDDATGACPEFSNIDWVLARLLGADELPGSRP